MTVEAKAKPQVAVMNAVHDLPVLVARDEGYFKDEPGYVSTLPS
jgi:hypothetical protein